MSARFAQYTGSEFPALHGTILRIARRNGLSVEAHVWHPARRAYSPVEIEVPSADIRATSAPLGAR